MSRLVEVLGTDLKKSTHRQVELLGHLYMVVQGGPDSKFNAKLRSPQLLEF